MTTRFDFEEQHNTITPQLVINIKQLEANIDHAIAIAGTPEKLWPHVKTHKMDAIVTMMVSKGITRFKCATIAEAQMAANCKATDVLLAYPLVGPNIQRFIALQEAFPSTAFYALSDDVEQTIIIDKECKKTNAHICLMCDVNVGMDRTGIGLDDLVSFFTRTADLENVSFIGLHCYDGHRHEQDFKERKAKTDLTYSMVREKMDQLKEMGFSLINPIMGGTPTFPCYACYDDAYCSPGTIFLNDAGYSANYKDLDFPPAAAVLTRVVSNPSHGCFTLDLGCKGIASDPAGLRGIIVGLDNVEEMFQSEEHWVWKMNKDHEDECPRVGQEFFVIPTHICPTSALYPFALAIADGHIADIYYTTARDRKITF